MTHPANNPLLRSLAAAGAYLALASLAHAEPGQDLLVGNGSPGPYALSWKNIEGGTETVQVGQQTQMRGIDYALDAIAGTVTFAHPLTAHFAASVHYDYDPARAVHRGFMGTVPVSFNLAERGGSRVSLDALYQGANGGAGAAAPGSLTLGLGTSIQGGGAQFATRLLFAPTLGGSAGADGGSSVSRMGLTLSGGTEAGRPIVVSFGYAQAGARLSTAGENGLTAGRQTLTLGTSLAPAKTVQASAQWIQSSPTAAGGSAAATQMAAAVLVTPAANISLQTHWTDSTGGNAPETQTADVRLHAAPTPSSTVEASFASRSSVGQSNDTQALNLAAALTASKAVAVQATVGQTRDHAGLVNQQRVALALTPGTALQIQTSLALHQTATVQTTVATFGGQVQPVSFLQFAAAYKGRTASPGDTALADTADTSLLRLTLLPLRGVRMTGSYAQNPDNDGSSAAQRLSQRGLGLETTFGALSMSGGYDWQRQADMQTVGTSLHVGVGLHLSAATQLDGTYQQTLSGVGEALAGSSLYGFGLTHSLGDRFHLSLEGTMQTPITTTATVTPDYTAHASLGMKF